MVDRLPQLKFFLGYILYMFYVYGSNHHPLHSNGKKRHKAK